MKSISKSYQLIALGLFSFMVGVFLYRSSLAD